MPPLYNLLMHLLCYLFYVSNPLYTPRLSLQREGALVQVNVQEPQELGLLDLSLLLASSFLG